MQGIFSFADIGADQNNNNNNKDPLDFTLSDNETSQITETESEWEKQQKQKKLSKANLDVVQSGVVEKKGEPEKQEFQNADLKKIVSKTADQGKAEQPIDDDDDEEEEDSSDFSFSEDVVKMTDGNDDSILGDGGEDEAEAFLLKQMEDAEATSAYGKAQKAFVSPTVNTNKVGDFVGVSQQRPNSGIKKDTGQLSQDRQDDLIYQKEKEVEAQKLVSELNEMRKQLEAEKEANLQQVGAEKQRTLKELESEREATRKKLASEQEANIRLIEAEKEKNLKELEAERQQLAKEREAKTQEMERKAANRMKDLETEEDERRRKLEDLEKDLRERIRLQETQLQDSMETKKREKVTCAIFQSSAL